MPTVDQGSIRRVTAIEQDGSGGRTRSLASQRGQLHENLSTLGTQKALRAFGLHDTRKSNKARLTRKSQLPRPPAPSVGSASF